jgi:hypothetical protein
MAFNCLLIVILIFYEKIFGLYGGHFFLNENQGGKISSREEREGPLRKKLSHGQYGNTDTHGQFFLSTSLSVFSVCSVGFIYPQITRINTDSFYI